MSTNLQVFAYAIYAKLQKVTKECSSAQAKHMSEFCGIQLSEIQISLYVFLRQGEICADIEPELLKHFESLKIHCLSDQQLLAEIIRLTDETNHKIFTSSYPNIFES